MGPFHTTINTKGEKNKMQSFLIPEKTSPDITILLCIKIMFNVFYIGNTFVLFATLRHFGRYQQFSDALYGVYTNVFRQVQKL